MRKAGNKVVSCNGEETNAGRGRGSRRHKEILKRTRKSKILAKIKEIYEKRFPADQESFGGERRQIGYPKKNAKRVGLGYLSDDDHGLLLQFTDPTRNFIYHPQDFEVSEPELIPRDHFTDPAERESVRLAAAQNGVLHRNKVKQNLPLRVGLFNLFIYIQQKVAKLRRENGEEIGQTARTKAKIRQVWSVTKNQAWSSKMHSKFWDGTWIDLTRKSERGKSSKKQQNRPTWDRESWEAILGIFEAESRAA